MPYKSEKIKLNEKQDRRRKLTESQKNDIWEMYIIRFLFLYDFE